MTDRTVVDADGRVIKVRELDPSDMLNLAELGGEGATSRWMQLAMIMFGVQMIDDKPVPPCTTKKHVLDLAKLVGNNGLVALRKELLGLTPEEREAGETAAGAPTDETSVAKN